MFNDFLWLEDHSFTYISLIKNVSDKTACRLQFMILSLAFFSSFFKMALALKLPLENTSTEQMLIKQETVWKFTYAMQT